MSLDRLRPRLRRAKRAFGCCALAWLSTPISATAQVALGQNPPTAATTPELTPAERAQRDADKVFRWILIHSDKPRKAAATKEPGVPRAKPPTRIAVNKGEDTAPVASPVVAGATAQPLPTAVPEGSSTPVPTPPGAAGPGAPAAAEPVADAPATERAEPRAPAAEALAAIAPGEDAADEVLVAVSRVDPTLPASVLRAVRNGQVRVRFTVLPDGSVAEPTVASSTNPRLNASALEAVAQWRFVPLRKAQPGSVELVFQLP